jgi:hypothetical protein
MINFSVAIRSTRERFDCCLSKTMSRIQIENFQSISYKNMIILIRLHKNFGPVDPSFEFEEGLLGENESQLNF